jgi:pimeloyl-ACP methyl ester carboxylesterase
MRGTQKQHVRARQLGRALLAVAALSITGTGCSESNGRFTTEDQYGRTYYIDGAGNWGFGQVAVPRGLHRAGYQGRVTCFHWSATLNPALDQVLGRTVAKARSRHLAEDISHYLAEFPNNRVNIIALSAGTGVAVWACEHLKRPAMVENLILLSSSLSSDYDMREALAHIRGKVYVYCSPNDGVLQGPVRVLGTIDGRFDSESAGLVGLRSSLNDPRICNIAWSPRHEALGWTGSHVSSVNEQFVNQVLANHLVQSSYTAKGPAGTADNVGIAVAQ